MMNGHVDDRSHGNHATRLPDANDPKLLLAHPTEAETDAQLRSNGAAWKGALSLDNYLLREAHLAIQDATKDGGLTSWVLVDSADESKRRVLCGCDTYRKRALVASDGKVIETVVHGIGSVFCPPDMRGQGYASRMMKDVGERLKNWQTPSQSLFSVLYSDIGKQFYAKHGWTPFPSSHISLQASTNVSKVDLPPTRAVCTADIAKLCATDEMLIRKSLETKAAKSDSTFVAVIPDTQTIKWHHAREEFVGSKLLKSVPDVKGAIAGNVEGQRVWCFWTRMWYNNDPTSIEENTLHIIRLVVEEKEIIYWNGAEQTIEDKSQYAPAVAALLKAAVEQADEWLCETVEVWNPNAITVAAARLLDPSAQVINRDTESVCSLRWNGDEAVRNKLVWLANEKYGWC